MSTFRPRTLPCPACARPMEVHLLEGMHISRIPQVRAAILDGSLHVFSCSGCAHRFVVEVPAIYTDFPNGQYVAVEVGAPADLAPVRGKHRRVFDECFTLGPPPAQDLAVALRTRLVFGYSALREKLLVWDAGLDDRVVESAKGDWFEAEGVDPAREHLRVVSVLDGGHLLCLRLEAPPPGAPGETETFVRSAPRALDFVTLPAASYQRALLRRAERLAERPWLTDDWLVDISVGRPAASSAIPG